MRYAIVSDLHANQQAWNAVWLDIQSSRVDRIIGLGDVVGYGPAPEPVFAAVHAHVHDCVLGNHDAAFCGKLDATLFSEPAQASLEWTRRQLGRAAADFCARMPLVLAGPGFRCAHGDFAEPGRFPYVAEPEDAAPSWQAAPEPLLFTGHTHIPALFLLGPSGVPRRVPPQDFALEPGKRYLVNPGSVGLPRDGDLRAAWCLYDSRAQAVWFRRVPFDLDGFRAELDQAGLTGTLDWFFEQDPRAAAKPLRAMTGFRPPTAGESGARNAVPLREIGALRRKARAWRLLAAFLALLLAGGAGVITLAVLRASSKSAYIAGAGARLIAPADRPAGEPFVRTPPPAPVGAPFEGWSVSLGNRRRQSVVCAADPVTGAPVLTLRSDDPRAELTLISAPVHAEGLGDVTLEGMVRKGADFSGTLTFAVPLVRESPAGPETLDHFLVKEPNQPRRDGWLYARQTAALPARTATVRLEVRARFTGSVEIKELALSGRSERTP